jgi:hypothetical protein
MALGGNFNHRPRAARPPHPAAVFRRSPLKANHISE